MFKTKTYGPAYDSADIASMIDAAGIIACEFRKLAREAARGGHLYTAAHHARLAAAASRITAARHQDKADALARDYRIWAVECEASAREYEVQARARPRGWDAVDTASE